MRFLIVVILIVNVLVAKNYKSINIGYIIENSDVNHPLMSNSDTVYSYAYRINGIHLKQNHLVLVDVKYYPNQTFAKGFYNNQRYSSEIQSLDLSAKIGFKKYIIPFVYFVPLVGLRYNNYELKYSINYDETTKSSEKDFFVVPLDVGIGYSLAPTSDIILFYNIDEDLTNLSSYEYKKISLNWYHIFKNNFSIIAQMGKITETNKDDFKQTKNFLSLTIGLRF
jgi:hypothetical protein